MSRSNGSGRGKQINGEITGHLGSALIGDDGYYARRHDDNVGSPSAKKEAKRRVGRARRRTLNRPKVED